METSSILDLALVREYELYYTYTMMDQVVLGVAQFLGVHEQTMHALLGGSRGFQERWGKQYAWKPVYLARMAQLVGLPLNEKHKLLRYVGPPLQDEDFEQLPESPLREALIKMVMLPPSLQTVLGLSREQFLEQAQEGFDEDQLAALGQYLGISGDVLSQSPPSGEEGYLEYRLYIEAWREQVNAGTIRRTNLYRRYTLTRLPNIFFANLMGYSAATLSLRFHTEPHRYSGIRDPEELAHWASLFGTSPGELMEVYETEVRDDAWFGRRLRLLTKGGTYLEHVLRYTRRRTGAYQVLLGLTGEELVAKAKGEEPFTHAEWTILEKELAPISANVWGYRLPLPT